MHIMHIYPCIMVELCCCRQIESVTEWLCQRLRRSMHGWSRYDYSYVDTVFDKDLFYEATSRGCTMVYSPSMELCGSTPELVVKQAECTSLYSFGVAARIHFALLCFLSQLPPFRV